MSQYKSLLDLYKLLWEQIKDKPRIYSLIRECHVLRIANKITNDEYWIIDENIRIEYFNRCLKNNTEFRKEFVQRMIKELEDGK